MELGEGSYGRLARLALYAFCFALPQTAALFFEMEYDGRLTLMRLAGRPTSTLVLRAMFASATPWAIAGFILLAAAFLTNRIDPHGVVWIAAIAGLPSVAAMAMLAAPGVSRRMDPRIAITGLAALGLFVGVAGANLLEDAPMVSVRRVALVAAIESALIVGLAARVPTAIIRPIFSSAAPPSFLLFRHLLIRWPGFYRGLAVGAPGVFLFVIVAPLILFARLAQVFRQDDDRLIAASVAIYVPLVIGAFAISWICREDVVTRRLDLIRQSSRHIALVAFELIAGLWTPFVLASIGSFLLTLIVFGQSPDIQVFAGAFLALLLGAPVPLMEGWQGAVPATFAVPLLFAAVISLSLIGWPALALLSATVWIAAARMLRHSDRILPEPMGTVVLGLFSLAPLTMARHPLTIGSPLTQLVSLAMGLYLALIVLTLSPLLIAPRSRDKRRQWSQPAAIGLAALITGTTRVGVVSAAFMALIGVLAWLQADRVRQYEPAHPVAQPAIRMSMLAVSGFLVRQLDRPRPRDERLVALARIAAATAMMEVMMLGFRLVRRRGTIPRP